MSSTTTSRLGLIKPTPGTGEIVNVATQINASWDTIDAEIGAGIYTSSTRPLAPYQHKIIRETDTGRLYVHNGTTPASGGWMQIPAQGGSFLQPPGSSTATSRYILASGVATSNRAMSFRGSTDTQDHFFFDYDGTIQWGSGSVASDTNLYRSAANTLKTDDLFVAGGGISLGSAGATTVQYEASAADTITAASYVSYTAIPTGGAGVGSARGTFVVPPSGKVMIHNFAGIVALTSGGSLWCSFEIRDGSTIGSGTPRLSGNDSYALRIKGANATNDVQFGMSYLWDAGTPGSTYNIQQMYKIESSAGGAVASRKRITIVPVT